MNDYQQLFQRNHLTISIPLSQDQFTIMSSDLPILKTKKYEIPKK